MAAAAQEDPDFEERLREIFERNPLPPDVAESMFREASDFGPGLDLKHFEETIIKPLSAIQVKETGDDLGFELDEGLGG